MGARRRRSSFAGPLHGRGVRRLRRPGETDANASQPAISKIFRFTEIRNCRMCRPSQPTKGAVVRRHERGLGVAVDAGGVKGGLVRAGRDEPREHGTNRIDGRRPCLRSLRWSRTMSCEALGEAVSLRTAKPCGPGRRCYGQAFAKASLRQPARCREFRGGDGGKKELVSGESAA
jgi:hypothetical protein